MSEIATHKVHNTSHRAGSITSNLNGMTVNNWLHLFTNNNVNISWEDLVKQIGNFYMLIFL